MKKSFVPFVLILLIACTCFFVLGCSLSKRTPNDKQMEQTKNSIFKDTSSVRTDIGQLRLDTFYKKFIYADGLIIASSGKVPDEALIQAKLIVHRMLEKIPEVIPVMTRFHVHIAIIAADEKPTDIPEHRDLNTAFPKTNWDTRGRGYGATKARPVTSCGEENLLCYPNDRYFGENILVHEFAHTVHLLGLRFTDPEFDNNLKKAYNHAKYTGLWANTYAISAINEYWAEGVQDWFNVNLQSIPADGIHNEVHSRLELKVYDPALYSLIEKYFIGDENKFGCRGVDSMNK